jgi:hypothetical protein
VTPDQTETVERLRMLLGDERVVREISMFGTRAFMVDEQLKFWVEVALAHDRAATVP